MRIQFELRAKLLKVYYLWLNAVSFFFIYVRIFSQKIQDERDKKKNSRVRK